MTFEAVVVAFDEARGDGLVRDARGREFYFHCVSIADGSRRVDVGATVRARRRVGMRGYDEAQDLVKA
ncbi:MAG: hypothetical protein HIU57_02330 [Acidobacteria bacterium]|nr:hypothetical protein [Acidobacteriota bacterium]